MDPISRRNLTATMAAGLLTAMSAGGQTSDVRHECTGVSIADPVGECDAGIHD
jgi:hypothetical protein